MKLKWTAAALALACSCAPAWAINKCVGADGRVEFQDAPCADGRGGRIDVRPASGHAPSKASEPVGNAEVPAPAAAPAAAAPPLPAPAPASPPVKDALTRDADTCFAWYRPDLLDPRGAYYTEPARDKRVVSLTLHATNRMGGVVTKRVACEILNGKLDEDWTKIHAERVKW